MALDPDLAGRTFPSTPPYLVSREKIAEFVTAIGAEPEEPGEVAPPPFPIRLPSPARGLRPPPPLLGVARHNSVQGAPGFAHPRPVRAADRLVGTLTVDSLRTAGGVDRIGTRTEVTTVDGEPVSTAFATLIHREGPHD